MGSCVMIAWGTFLQERRDGRVVMGYLLGLAMTAYFANHFLGYALELEEPVNILETFCVVENNCMNLLFLPLGWIFVIADAPFVKNSTYFLLYRCGRKRWNAGMLLYLFGQAFFYTACLAAFTVAFSSSQGFVGDIWSSPAYFLTTDLGRNIAVKHYVSFPQAVMMKSMTVPRAFAVSFLFLYLYLVFLGVLLYVCNLLMPGILGAVATLLVHMLGYLRRMEGNGHISLLAQAAPGNLMDGSLRYWNSVALFLGLIAAGVFFTVIFIKKADLGAGESMR